MEQEADAIDIVSLLRILRANILPILAITVLTISCGVAYLLSATPVFRASTVLMLESREESVAGLDAVLGSLSVGDSTVVNTEVEVLRGRTLMGRVVDDLDLVNDPEFNGSLRPAALSDRLRALLPSFSSPGPELTPQEQAVRTRELVISALLDNVAIANTSRSLVFRITAESESARKAALIADKLAELYIDDQLRVRFEAMEVATTWLSNQIVTLRQNFEQAEAEVRAFRSGITLIDRESLAALDRQMKENRRRIEQISQQIADSNALTLRLDASTDPLVKAEVLNNDSLRQLAQAASQGDAAARTRFETELAKIVAQRQQEQLRLSNQVRLLQEGEAALGAQIELQSKDLAQLELLTRQADSDRMLYEHFQTRLNETSAQQGIQKADSRILSPAVVPTAAATPRKGMTLALAGALGLVFGALLVLLREKMTIRVRTTRELEAVSGRAVLAQIPEAPEKTRKNVLAYLQKNPTSAMAEAVRTLRTSVLLSSVDSPPQVIVMTSSVPSEGKTTTTLALAQNLTAMGKKVLLMEGDVRSCTLAQYFDTIPQNTPGIASVISGEAQLADAVVSVPGIGDLLPGKKTAVNAADLFSSKRFAGLVAEARSTYDIVLIDTPPVLVVPDSMIIAQQADALLFSVHWDRTSPGQVAESMNKLGLVGISVTGLILNRVDPKGMRRYGYGDTYGGYGKYGSAYYTSG